VKRGKLSSTKRKIWITMPNRKLLSSPGCGFRHVKLFGLIRIDFLINSSNLKWVIP
jgi:hypothetical protein